MSGRPRSFADDLRGRDDDELATLLRLRPDLTVPLPSDLGQLAARALTPASTQRAVDRLDTFRLHVLQAAVVAHASSEAAGSAGSEPAGLGALLPDATAEDVAEAVQQLVALGLLWGDPSEVQPTSTVREVLGATPAGLGPSRATLRRTLAGNGDGSTEAVRGELAALADAPPGVRETLDQLTWGPPFGSVERADREVTRDSARTPVEWLLAHGILVAVDASTVVLPRELALELRGGRLFRDDAVHPPPFPDVAGDQQRVDQAGAGAAFDLVRRTEELLEAWSTEPASVLRAGGLGVRELQSVAQRLDVDLDTAALVVEVAYVAGLLARSEELDDQWLPTPAFDRWSAQSMADRWVDLTAAWLESTRATGLVGSRDERDQRRNALAPDLDRMVVPEVRHAVLDDLRERSVLAPGAPVSVDVLVERQRWRRPRRGGPLRDDLVRWTVREGADVGVVALGALTTAGRCLVEGRPDDAAAALDPLLPRPVDHVLLQADLTAVAPGPLEPTLARELSLAADVESSGGATVLRFTEASVRRALDAGRSAADLHALFARASRTEVPQPLSYLVDDVARRHGRVRVGAASGYVRCDDPTTLDEVLAHRGADALRLRRLAPTVLVAGVTPDVLLERLRAMNVSPVAESATGAVVVRRLDAQRTGERAHPPRLAAEPEVPDAVLAAAVRALRAGDRGTVAGDRVVGPAGSADMPRTAVADTLTALREAADARRSVWIGYVDDDGTARERVVDPVEVRAGRLTAFDHRREQVRSFAVHRITGVALLDPAATPPGPAPSGP